MAFWQGTIFILFILFFLLFYWLLAHQAPRDFYLLLTPHKDLLAVHGWHWVWSRFPEKIERIDIIYKSGYAELVCVKWSRKWVYTWIKQSFRDAGCLVCIWSRPSLRWRWEAAPLAPPNDQVPGCSCPAGVTSFLVSELGHVSDVGHWNTNERNVSGSLLGTSTLRLASWTTPFESCFCIVAKVKQLCGGVYIDMNGRPWKPPHVNSQGQPAPAQPHEHGHWEFPTIPASQPQHVVFPSWNNFGLSTLISVTHPWPTNNNRHNTTLMQHLLYTRHRDKWFLIVW